MWIELWTQKLYSSESRLSYQISYGFTCSGGCLSYELNSWLRFLSILWLMNIARALLHLERKRDKKWKSRPVCNVTVCAFAVVVACVSLKGSEACLGSYCQWTKSFTSCRACVGDVFCSDIFFLLLLLLLLSCLICFYFSLFFMPLATYSLLPPLTTAFLHWLVFLQLVSCYIPSLTTL